MPKNARKVKIVDNSLNYGYNLSYCKVKANCKFKVDFAKTKHLLMSDFFSGKHLAKLGIFAALSTALYFLKFPLPFFPQFLEINFSDIPALICSFALGPLSGFIAVLIKILIKLPFTSTFCVGELADLLIGGAFVVVAGIVYKKHKNKKGALRGITFGTISSVIVAMILNRVLILPFYMAVMNYPYETIVNMCAAVMPFINESNFYACYIFAAVLPFNLLRCLIAAVLTWLVYKRISNLLNKM